MTVLGCVEHYTEARARELAQDGVILTTFEEVITQSDFISLHVPKTPQTTNMINADVIRRMKPGAFLVNLARGGVADEQALYQALVSGYLGGAALDVHAAEGEGKISPLASLNNVLLTPHIGAGTFDSQREIGEIAVARIRAFAEEEESMILQPGYWRARASAILVV
jgi:phosphoglycerate dehydrogenase-like enzyme